jgi:hypothetical protein
MHAKRAMVGWRNQQNCCSGRAPLLGELSIASNSLCGKRLQPLHDAAQSKQLLQVYVGLVVHNYFNASRQSF